MLKKVIASVIAEKCEQKSVEATMNGVLKEWIGKPKAPKK